MSDEGGDQEQDNDDSKEKTGQAQAPAAGLMQDQVPLVVAGGAVDQADQEDHERQVPVESEPLKVREGDDRGRRAEHVTPCFVTRCQGDQVSPYPPVTLSSSSGFVTTNAGPASAS